MSIESEIIWLRVLVQLWREQEVLQAELLDFDTWYQRRQHQAHVEYMKRTSKHLVCDWRITGASSPEEVSRFFNTNPRRGAHATTC